MSKSSYHPLSADSDEDVSPAPQSSLGRYGRWILRVLATCVGIALAGLLVKLLLFPSPRWTHCGSTVEEARARNCQYDVMIGSWLLPECSDIELMEEYLAKRDWEFYRDDNLTEVLDMDELRRGEHTFPVYATVHQHQHHCAYVWVKQFRAVVAGKKLDDLTASVNHTTHCADGLYTGMPGAKGNLALAVKYFSCVDAGYGNPRRENNPNNILVPAHHHDE